MPHLERSTSSIVRTGEPSHMCPQILRMHTRCKMFSLFTLVLIGVVAGCLDVPEFGKSCSNDGDCLAGYKCIQIEDEGLCVPIDSGVLRGGGNRDGGGSDASDDGGGSDELFCFENMPTG